VRSTQKLDYTTAVSLGVATLESKDWVHPTRITEHSESPLLALRNVLMLGRGHFQVLSQTWNSHHVHRCFLSDLNRPQPTLGRTKDSKSVVSRYATLRREREALSLERRTGCDTVLRERPLSPLR
jgi:hypothetical protein